MPKGGPPYLPSSYLKEKGLTTAVEVTDLTYKRCRELGITIEGMSVAIPQTMVISEYFNFDRFG